MLPGWVHLGRATRAALATWAPEQDCPYVICLLLKTGMWHHLTSLIPSVDHILLFVIVFPMVKFAFLLKFPSLLFSEHPCYLLTLVFPQSLRSGRQELPSYLKFHYSHPPIAHHQSCIWFIPDRSKISIEMSTGNQKDKNLSFLKVKHGLSNVCTTL